MITRDACLKVGAVVQKLHGDDYSKVDFRVFADGRVDGPGCRVQDKVPSGTLNVRNLGIHPINPDDIDAFQISIGHNEVYLIPFRTRLDDGRIVPTFTEKQLMHRISICKSWKTENAAYLHDMSNEEGIRSYVAACVHSRSIGLISDRGFYSKLISDNSDLFEEESKKKRAYRMKLRRAGQA
jgi:hypothetical protein